MFPQGDWARSNVLPSLWTLTNLQSKRGLRRKGHIGDI